MELQSYCSVFFRPWILQTSTKLSSTLHLSPITCIVEAHCAQHTIEYESDITIYLDDRWWKLQSFSDRRAVSCLMSLSYERKICFLNSEPGKKNSQSTSLINYCEFLKDLHYRKWLVVWLNVFSRFRCKIASACTTKEGWNQVSILLHECDNLHTATLLFILRAHRRLCMRCRTACLYRYIACINESCWLVTLTEVKVMVNATL